MVLTERELGRLINDLNDNVDYTYESWDPNMKVWRATEPHSQKLPFVSVDEITAGKPMFQSLGDVIGKENVDYYKYGYCELEMINISVHANKYHHNRNIEGRGFAKASLLKIRQRILRNWDDILKTIGASRDRSKGLTIRDLSKYHPDVGTRKYEFDMDVYIRTDLRWDKKPDDYDETILTLAEEAYITLNNKDNIRVIYDG